MKFMLSSGVVLESNNESLIQQYLKYGATEIKDSVETEDNTPKRGRKKSVD